VRQGREPDPFAQVDVQRAAEYSGEDSDMTLHVHQSCGRSCEAEPGLRCSSTRSIEMPVATMLGRIERNGVLIDAAVLARQSHELAERMMALSSEAYELAGQPFNLGSPKQIGEILFGKLGLPVKKKTASGAPSPPTKRCCRNWPPTTRCRPSCWSTAAWPSSRAPTPTSCR
jgi:DNA polymerase-1